MLRHARHTNAQNVLLVDQKSSAQETSQMQIVSIVMYA